MKGDYRIIDSDIHLIEPADLWTEYLPAAFRERAPRAPREGFAMLEVGGRTVPAYMDHPGRQRAWQLRMERIARRMGEGIGPALPKQKGVATDPDDMLAAMDAEGVDLAIVFRTFAGHVTVIDTIDPDFAAALCRAYNHWLRDFCAADARRLKVAALLPVQDVALAVAEAKHAVRDLDAVALVLPSHPVGDRTLDDPAFDPLWRTAQELDVAVAFHGIHTAYGDHIARRYLSNLPLAHAAGQPVELMLALGSMLTGGALARFPHLRCAFLEGNCSWVPWWLWALDERWEKWGDVERTRQKERPSELFRRQCFVSVEPDEKLAAHAIAELGADSFVISTDWPHDDSAFPHAIDGFLSVPGISPEARRKILWDNCARLYGIEGVTGAARRA